jgi:hypothetical protein
MISRVISLARSLAALFASEVCGSFTSGSGNRGILIFSRKLMITGSFSPAAARALIMFRSKGWIFSRVGSSIASGFPVSRLISAWGTETAAAGRALEEKSTTLPFSSTAALMRLKGSSASLGRGGACVLASPLVKRRTRPRTRARAVLQPTGWPLRDFIASSFLLNPGFPRYRPHSNHYALNQSSPQALAARKR